MNSPYPMNTPASGSASRALSAVAALPVHRTDVVTRVLRLAGLNALVNGLGFGAFSLPGAWHLAHEHAVWIANGKPTYGYGPFEDHGLSTTVPLLMAFFGSCLVLALGGALLLIPRSNGIVVTLAGLISCAPFWWGFDLPLAWVNAAVITSLLASAAGARVVAIAGRVGLAAHDARPDLAPPARLRCPKDHRAARPSDDGRRHG